MNCMNLFLIVMINYLTYIMIYKYGFRYRLNVRGGLPTFLCVFVFLICYKNTCSYSNELGGVQLAGMISGVTIPIFMLYDRNIKNILQYICVAFGTLLVNTWGQYICVVIMLKKNIEEPQETVSWILYHIFMLIIITVYSAFVRNKPKSNETLHITSIQYVIFLYGVLTFGILCGAIGYIEKTTEISKSTFAAMQLLVSAISVIFVVLSIWQGVIIKKQVTARLKNELYEQYIREQERYINDIRLKDEEMRKFRHDINAHMMILQTYCENNDKNRFSDYLAQIKGKMELYEIKRYTGHSAVDAVIGTLINNAQEKGVEVKWHGELKNDIDIMVYDLCTLFYNLIKNSVEAALKMPSGEGWIEVKIYPYNNRVYICVKNSYAGQITKNRNGDILTSKKEKDLHGIGMKNIKSTIQKYGGEIENKYMDNIFIVEIIL